MPLSKVNRFPPWQCLLNSTSELKALALDALDIKVIAKTINDIEIQGVIPLELASPTIEQTSGCLISCTYEWPSKTEAIVIIPKNGLFLSRLISE